MLTACKVGGPTKTMTPQVMVALFGLRYGLLPPETVLAHDAAHDRKVAGGVMACPSNHGVLWYWVVRNWLVAAKRS